MKYQAVLLSAAILAGTAVQTRAQDALSWGGFYGGVSINATNTDAKVGSNAIHKYRTKAATLGLFAGYNFARDSGFVWGPELAIQTINASAKILNPT